ncbi:MAG: DoxX family protein [Chloroflexi bacterium]|nr:MAG: DoxX family protein [Chloroflexota bacterium]TMG58051.1 MAG: DoxX family protein [Chloroflexota bacterium]
MAQGPPQPAAFQHRFLGAQAPRGDPQRSDPAPLEPHAHATRGSCVPARNRPRIEGDEVTTITRVQEIWPSLFRIVVGLYWLYFASQKWQGVGWMKPLIESTSRANPIPGLHEFLVAVVVPNWLPFALAQAVGETVVAVALILGLATRWAGVLGFLLAANLALTVAFGVNDDGFRWIYYLAVLVNAQVIMSGGGPIAFGRFGWVPAWLR